MPTSHRTPARLAVPALLTVTAFAAFLGILKYDEVLRDRFCLGTKIYSWDIQDGQVIQRSDGERTVVSLLGRCGIRAKSVEVCVMPPARAQDPVRPEDWVSLDAAPKMSRFAGNVQVQDGWSRIFGRSHGEGFRSANSLMLGAGEVFLVAGQSNASGSSSTLFQATSDDVRKGQVQADGSLRWMRGDDPQIRGGGGSHWPLTGDLLVQKLGVPVGWINVAEGGSSIRKWEPGSANFNRLVKAMKAAGPNGARAVLWAQGESDGHMSTEEYRDRLVQIIKSARDRSDVDIPWMVAVSTYNGRVTSESVRTAQRQLCLDGTVICGPDTDRLAEARYREGPLFVHFNEAGTRELAVGWFEAIDQNIFGNMHQPAADHV